MDIEKYNTVLTYDSSKEMKRIYEYIAENLYAKKASDNLMIDVENKVSYLDFCPKIYAEIEKINEVKRKYRRIAIKNYILLYTINEYGKMIYVSHMYYGRRNYMKIFS